MNPIDAIIERFGGTTALARALSIPVTTVHSWKRRGMIPSARMADVLDAARGASVDVSAEELVRCAAARAEAA